MPVFREKGIEVWVKRDDLKDPFFGGNKFRKLAGIFHEAALEGKRGIVSFGGPFSNHLIAVAALAHRREIPFRAIVRGHVVRNPALDKIAAWGASIEFVPNDSFKMVEDEWITIPKDYLVIPMGGFDQNALFGVAEMMAEIEAHSPRLPTHYGVGAGTGTTAAGMASVILSSQELMVFPALKFPAPRLWFDQVLHEMEVCPKGQLAVFGEAAGKGYARFEEWIPRFIDECTEEYDLPWDPVYGVKMAREVITLTEADYFPRGSFLVLIHTGGWAGKVGFYHRYASRIN
jgi:1-aminocyclopropane-1-carboxylate deaminase